MSTGPPSSQARLRPRLGERTRILLLLSPALAVVLLLFVGGLVLGLLQSLNYLPLIDQYELNLRAYADALGSEDFSRGLEVSMYIAVTSTVLAAAVAILIGLLLRRTVRGRRLLTFIFQLNLPIPHLVGAVAMLLLFANSGLMSRLSYAVGATDSTADFVSLVRDPFAFAIIAEYVWKETPFIGVVVLAALASGIEGYEDVARSLGAGAWQRFRHIVLPMIAPGVVATSIISFAFAFGTYEVPALLGETYPKPLPVLAYQYFGDVELGTRSEALALCMIISVIVGVLVLYYMRLTRRHVRADR